MARKKIDSIQPSTAAEAFAKHAASQSTAPSQPAAPVQPAGQPSKKTRNVNSGTFTKGMEKVPGSGRKKGVVNKSTKQAREIFAQILQEQIDMQHISQALNAVFIESPKDYLASIFKLAQFNIPALQSVEHKTDSEAINPFVAHMTAMVQLSQDIEKSKIK